MAGNALLADVEGLERNEFTVHSAESLLERAEDFFMDSLKRVYTDPGTHLGLAATFLKKCACVNFRFFFFFLLFS